MQTKKPGRVLFRLLITIVFMALGGWLFYFNWLQRPIRYRTYTFTIEESQRLKPFARAQYAYGLHAWFQNDPETAAGFFRQAVSQDLFFFLNPQFSLLSLLMLLYLMHKLQKSFSL